MTKRKTTLTRKALPTQGTASNNYRLITCLLIMWKMLTTRIREEIYYSLISCGLFPEEQKGFYKVTRGTGDLYIEQLILIRKTRRKNVVMGWVDYEKA